MFVGTKNSNGHLAATAGDRNAKVRANNNECWTTAADNKNDEYGNKTTMRDNANMMTMMMMIMMMMMMKPQSVRPCRK